MLQAEFLEPGCVIFLFGTSGPRACVRTWFWSKLRTPAQKQRNGLKRYRYQDCFHTDGSDKRANCPTAEGIMGNLLQLLILKEQQSAEEQNEGWRGHREVIR
ncbi:hypothetical protein CHARACLAT_012236 [Characodon lateralis]|uniref:MHC class I antigen n=1 Tax=Characodon lateralis TaxID=208331 RepID=A0ABU7CPX6_9TELE|nr:hypothetical protein [Characodon lateralis]